MEQQCSHDCYTAMQCVLQAHLELLDTIGAQAVIHVTKQAIHQIPSISRQRDLRHVQIPRVKVSGHAICHMVHYSAEPSSQ